MPAGLVHDEEAGAVAQRLAQMRKKQVHHRGVDPGQKQAVLLAGQRAYCAVNIEVLVARPNDDRRPNAFVRPAPPNHRLKAEPPLIKEKNQGFRPVA